MPQIDRASRKYQILGIHDSEVHTVEGNVARIRMYIGDDYVDEDFPLPQVISVEQQLDSAINARITELVNGRIADAAEQGKTESSEGNQ